MTKLPDLHETRGIKVAEMTGIVEGAERAGRDLDDGERGRFDGLKGEVRALDERIARAQTLAEYERRAAADPITPSGDHAEMERRYRPGKALAEFVETGRLSGAEAEWSAEHRSGRANAIAMPTSVFLGETRALLTTTPVDGPGGNLVARTLGTMVDRVRPALAIEQLGATVLPNLTGNLDLPRLKDSGRSFWVAEHQPVTRTDPRFDKISMSPRTVGAEYEVSRRMMIQVPALETILRADLSYLLRQALDGAAIKGGGAEQPTGILATSGVKRHLLGANGGPFTLDAAAELIALVEPGEGSRGFLTNGKVRKTAMTTKSGEGVPLGVAAVFQNEGVVYANSVPSDFTKGTGTGLSAVIYGVWSDLILGYWSSVDVLVNPYHTDVASRGGVLLHAFLDCDVAVRHPENFAICMDVTTS